MTTRRLATHVAVTGPDGAVVVLGPGEEVPGWAAGQVTNPAAYTTGTPDYESQRKADLEAEAERRGIEVPAQATKVDIVAALRDADGT